MIESAYDEIQTGLTNILNELHSGLFGQREVWEKCLQAAISRLSAPPPEEIAELIERLAASTVASCTCNTKTPDPAHHKGDCRYYALESAIAALRSLAQQNKALNRMAYERWEIANSRIRELESERDAIKERAIEANAANLETIGAIRAKTIEECAAEADRWGDPQIRDAILSLLTPPPLVKEYSTSEELDALLNKPEPDVIVNPDGSCSPPPATESEVMPSDRGRSLEISEPTSANDARPPSATGAAPPPDIEGLILELHVVPTQLPGHLVLRVIAALRSLARELERTKDDLRRVESVYNFAKLSAERDSLMQEVEILKWRIYIAFESDNEIAKEATRMKQRVRELEAEVERLTAERDSLVQEVERQMQRALRVEAHLKDSIAAGESYGAEHDRDHQRIRELEDKCKSQEFKPQWRHKKRGSVYMVIGRATLQTDTPLPDMAPMFVYQAQDGTLWVRSELEFFDGRFEMIEDKKDG